MSFLMSCPSVWLKWQWMSIIIIPVLLDYTGFQYLFQSRLSPWLDCWNKMLVSSVIGPVSFGHSGVQNKKCWTEKCLHLLPWCNKFIHLFVKKKITIFKEDCIKNKAKDDYQCLKWWKIGEVSSKSFLLVYDRRLKKKMQSFTKTQMFKYTAVLFLSLF